MKAALITELEKVCPNNVYLQGTLSSTEAYPTEFITFWTDYTNDRAHYDNAVTSYDWSFSVMVYATDPDRVVALANSARTYLKAAGFIPQGKGNDIASGEPTHTGWAMDYKKTEFITIQGV